MHGREGKGCVDREGKECCGGGGNGGVEEEVRDVWKGREWGREWGRY